MIEELMKHLKMMFTINEELVDKSFRSSFFEELEEINIYRFGDQGAQATSHHCEAILMWHCYLSARTVVHVGILLQLPG